MIEALSNQITISAYTILEPQTRQSEMFALFALVNTLTTMNHSLKCCCSELDLPFPARRDELFLEARAPSAILLVNKYKHKQDMQHLLKGSAVEFIKRFKTSVHLAQTNKLNPRGLQYLQASLIILAVMATLIRKPSSSLAFRHFGERVQHLKQYAFHLIRKIGINMVKESKFKEDALEPHYRRVRKDNLDLWKSLNQREPSDSAAYDRYYDSIAHDQSFFDKL